MTLPLPLPLTLTLALALTLTYMLSKTSLEYEATPPGMTSTTAGPLVW